MDVPLKGGRCQQCRRRPGWRRLCRGCRCQTAYGHGLTSSSLGSWQLHTLMSTLFGAIFMLWLHGLRPFARYERPVHQRGAYFGITDRCGSATCGVPFYAMLACATSSQLPRTRMTARTGKSTAGCVSGGTNKWGSYKPRCWSGAAVPVQTPV